MEEVKKNAHPNYRGDANRVVHNEYKQNYVKLDIPVLPSCMPPECTGRVNGVLLFHQQPSRGCWP